MQDSTTRQLAQKGGVWSEYFLSLFILGTFVFLVVGLIRRDCSNDERSTSNLPIVNSSPFGRCFSTIAQWRFIHSSKELIEQGQKKYPNRPFRILTDWGEVLMLTPDYAHNIRNDPHLSFTKAVSFDSHANIPGFETVKLISLSDNLVQLVARKQLTRHLSAVIGPLSDVTEEALVKNFGKSSEWIEVNLKDAIADIIARLSSRIYFGEQLYRNEAWLRIVKNYSSSFFTASSDLRRIPWLLRPLVHWLVPSCRALRSELRKARRLTQPYIDHRREMTKAAHKAKMPAPKFEDALQWAETEAQAKGLRYDPATFQLTLSLLAIHTTYDLLEICMIDLARHPDCIDKLRDEILEALRKEGWTKNALYSMKRVDSAIKESQRLKPGSITSMRRYATSDVSLSSKLVIKKGERLNVLTLHRSPELYPSPDTYDPYRFYKIRMQLGKENTAQLVSTSVEHMGFGHGEHSCPGRFFAANEIKVALAHILIKYDWKLVEDGGERTELKGMVEKAGSKVKVLVRRRANVEVDIDDL
ncbi:cytochrome P450 [Pyrenochaeta sp. MPI-SDFR-AT-0127]|nr:cytochrome P450 [Pyrenochaeta sp. MPI-SDFR-AT-0127]